jgi:dGTPase
MISETERRLKEFRPASAADIRHCSGVIAAFSPAVTDGVASLKQFLSGRMYRHPRVLSVMQNAQNLLSSLFGALLADPALLPEDWRSRCGAARDRVTARAVCDYVAGMTDRFAAQEYRRIFHMEFPL